ncbi:hypothetical protein [Streptomyces sp. NPDC046859]|uniref:hypothetical protein n=1 Tax=Streptomyces sp. NPDC046859 TaxID=3155734 RepID=UPI0033C4055D
MDDREAGIFSTERGKRDCRERYARLEERREKLASVPTVPDTWREIPTGETYAEMWARLETSTERYRELVEAGVRVTVHAEDLPPVLPLVEIGQREGDVTKHVGRVALTRPVLLGEWAKGRALATT